MVRIFKYNIADDFGFSIVSLKGQRKYYVEGYASTIDKDKAGEIISHSAQEDIYKQLLGENITLDIEHSEWYDENGKVLPKPKNTTIPVAKVVEARLDEKGVWIKAELNQNLSKFQEIWGSIKDGFLKAFSIAFFPLKKSESNPNVIERLNLVNITLTGSPVNPNATFVATMKSASAYLDSISYKPQHYEQYADAHIFKKNIKGEINMADEDIEKKKEIDEEDEEEKKKKEKKTEETEEPEVKCSEGKEAKVKSESNTTEDFNAQIKGVIEKYEAEIKALKEEIALIKENEAKLKAELEKPIMKATQQELPKNQVFKSITPLDLI